MKNIFNTHITFVLPPILTVLFYLNTNAQTNTEKDIVAIKEVISVNEAAYNRKDAMGVAQTYALDGDHIAFDNPILKGHQAISQLLEERWAEGFLEANTIIDGIRFITSEVAMVESRIKFGHDGPLVRGSWVMVRQEDNWLIAAARFFPAER